MDSIKGSKLHQSARELQQALMPTAKLLELRAATPKRSRRGHSDYEAGLLVPEDQPLTLANLSPSRPQKRLALAVALAFLAALFLSAGELANVQLRRIDAFVPIYSRAIFVNDLITAVLLFNQFTILRSRALLVISSGYFFTALMVIPWTLTFPGVFAPMVCLARGCKARIGFTFSDIQPFRRSSSCMHF
jgi:membrane-associated sensor protein